MNERYVIRKANIINFIFIISLIKPVGIEIAYPLLNMIWNCLKLLSMIAIVFQGLYYYLYKKQKVNSFILYILSMEILSIICCIFNNQSPYNAIVYWQTILSMIILADIQYKRNRIENFMNQYFNILFFMLIMNLISIVIYPSGINGSRLFFLGIDNMVILYIFPFMGMMILNNLINNVKKYSYKNIIYLVITIGMIIYSKSATSIIVGILFLLYYICFYKRKFTTKVLRKITARKYLIIITLFFILVVVYQIQEKFSYIIMDILGKDITFTGRTYIWSRVIELVKENPFGYGWDTNIYNVRSIMDWVTEFNPGHAHNYLLNLFYKSGIQTAIAFIIFIISISKKLDLFKIQKSNSGEIMFIKFCFFLNLLMFSFEAYPTNCINIYVVLYFMYRIDGIKFNKSK